VIGAVARAHGRSSRAQWAERYALTLWDWWQLQESEWAAALRRAQDRLEAARLINLALCDPKQLAVEGEKLKQRAGFMPTVEDARTEGLALAEEFQRVTDALASSDFSSGGA
jgi:hypothetical protein